jgi:tetratricopeptide (TPR) repeat protein
MPERTFRSIDARRDHGFHVPRPDLTVAIGTPNACSSCHAERGDAWAAQAVQSWRGDAPAPRHFAERLHARRSGGSAAGEELTSLAADEAMPAIARGTALVELGVGLSRERVDKAARAQDPLLRLAAARAGVSLEARSRVLAIARLLDDPLRAVRIEAAIALADVTGDGITDKQRAALGRALDEYRAAQAVAADSPASHVNLALLAQRLGDAKAAEESYLTALRIGDYFVPAYTGLAELYAAQSRDGDGATLLHRGLERSPDSADLHFALGMLLGRQVQIAAAIEELAAAARLAPEVAHFSYIYALALNEQKRPHEALAVLQRAAKRHPADQNVLASIAMIARDAGRFDEALAAAKQLQALFPNQPEARALIEEIEVRRAGGPGQPPGLPQ